HQISQPERETYRNFQGWEEGIVEQLQRMLRGPVVVKLGATLDEPANLAIDSEHGYNGYIEALEELRGALDEPQAVFYRRLLGVQLGERPGLVRRQLAPAQGRPDRVLLFMRAHGRLCRPPEVFRRHSNDA